MRSFDTNQFARLPEKLSNLLRQFVRRRSERRLTSRNYRDFYEKFSIGIYRSSPDGRQLRANPALVRLNGYDSEEDYHAVMGDLATEWYVDPARRAQFKQQLLANGFVENFVSEVYRHKTRERIWVVETARIVPDKSTGEPLYFEGTIQEITETHRKLEIEERFRKIAEQVPGCLFQYRRRPDGSAQMPFVSARILDIFGVSPESVKEDTSIMRRMVHPDDLEALRASLDKSEDELSPWNHEYRICLKDGTVKWIHGNAMLERAADGSTLWHGYFSDVSERKAIDAKVRELAFQDPLTGLTNRRLMLDRIEQALALSRRHRRWGALLFIDFDGFKTLNDTRGHAAGDDFLVEISKRLRSAVRESDTVARYSGDEFIVLPHLSSNTCAEARDEARTIGENLLSAVSIPVQLDGISTRMTASIGIALYRDGSSTAQSLLKRADGAMYKAKAGERSSLHIDDRVGEQGTAVATAAQIMMAS